jgi:hypothetical protein
MALTSATRRRRRQRTVAESRWIIAFPALVFLVVGLFPGQALVKPIGAVILVGLVVVVSKRPGPALTGLIVFVLVQPLVFPFLYERGVPANMLRAVTGVKEALIFSLLVAAITAIRAEGRRLDHLDRLVLTFIGGVTLFLAVPFLAGGDAPTDFSVRLQGFRTNALFLILFFAVRHAPIDAKWRKRALHTALGVVAVIAVVGLYQYLFPARFSDFVIDDIGAIAYQREVLQIPYAEVYQGFLWLTTDPIRAGSWLVSPFDFSDLMLIGAGMTMEFLVRDRARWWRVGLIGLCVAGILASHTRAALLGLAIGGIVALRPARGRSAFGRARFLLVGVAIIGMVAPNLLGTRFTGADGGSKSSSEHISELTTGLERVIERPLGAGLGTSPNVGVRDTGAVSADDVFISDNSILQVGQELGVVMMLLFVALLVALFRTLANAPPRGDLLAPAVRITMAALLAAGMLHHVFLAVPITWLVWSFAGLGAAAISAPERRTPGAFEATTA